ncbi:Intraflagellar transport protein 52 [Perkinsus olseni]|uniref:Intraflagellar transport protein 52 n=1 Tax=Perkinsus olseni TaxID=32597 RepID=A0A7J6S1L4_PEROL|nr:Intraflagellar transport protein 52 [Perkinsus olseni]KAF4725930.1 Intraflagellar transport protein 52 [Perkinsus olseni]
MSGCDGGGDVVVIKLLVGKTKDGLTLLKRMHKLKDLMLKNGWHVHHTNNSIITYDTLRGSNLVILPNPQCDFNLEEKDAVAKYINDGGSLLILSNEGGGDASGSINNILQDQYNININNDSLIRPVHHPMYHHPKEVIITVSGNIGSSGNKSVMTRRRSDDRHTSLCIIYPFGATLSSCSSAPPRNERATSPSTTGRILFHSGQLSYPMHRPLCLTTSSSSAAAAGGGGKVCVLGSHMLFTDEYIHREDNLILADNIISFLVEGTTSPQQPDLLFTIKGTVVAI